MGMKNSKAMEVIKKNLLSILCGVVAIAAVVATYWPVGGMFGTLQTATEQRRQVYTGLQELLTKSRQLPRTDPAKTQQDDLKTFPNKKTIDLGTSVTDAVHTQSIEMVKLIEDLNQQPHAPLVAYVLPNTGQDSLKSSFAQLYQAVLSTASPDDTDKYGRFAAALKAANLQNLRNDVLQGGIPPTPEQITQATADMKINKFDQLVIYENGQPKNQEQVTAQFNAAAAKLPDQMKYDVAQKHKMYVANDAFAVNPTLTGNALPDTVDIWYSQMTLWIQQDVAHALQEANANATNILDAPVKHLWKLAIPSTSAGGSTPFGPGIYTDATPAAGGAATPVAATPVDGSDILPLTPVPSVSVTGRVSNPMYDVVQFTLVIDVDASQIPAVLAALSHKQLMDVMSLTATAVDSDDMQQQGFFYGSAPVVQLTLSCEALFMRQWTQNLMPDSVKHLRGIAPPAPAQPAAQ
jgi:hypothetical protein